MASMIAHEQGTKRKRKPLDSRVTGRIDGETKERLGQIAEETGLDESDLLRLALSKFLPALSGAGSNVVQIEKGAEISPDAEILHLIARCREHGQDPREILLGALSEAAEREEKGGEG